MSKERLAEGLKEGLTGRVKELVEKAPTLARLLREERGGVKLEDVLAFSGVVLMPLSFVLGGATAEAGTGMGGALLIGGILTGATLVGASGMVHYLKNN